MISTLPLSNINIGTKICDNEIHVKVKKCKIDVMKTYYHYGSMSSCYSFGNKLMYGIVNNISVGVNINKK